MSCASVGRRAQWLIFEASQAGMSACWHSCLLAYFRNAWKSPSRAKEHALIHLDNVTGLGSWLTLCHAPTRGYNDRGKGKKKQMSWYNPQCFMGAFHICLWLLPSSSCCHNSHLLAGGTTITIQFWGGDSCVLRWTWWGRGGGGGGGGDCDERREGQRAHSMLPFHFKHM